MTEKERSLPTLPADLQDWIKAETGAESITLKQVPGGASRQAWFVNVNTPTGEQKLFLRYDPRPPKPGSAFHTLQVEAEILIALHTNGVCVPRVVAAHPVHQAMLMEQVTGETWFYLIKDPAEQVTIAQDFIAKLSAMHRIDTKDLDIPSFGPDRPVREHVLEEIAAMRRRIGDKKEPSPLLNFCVDWLERNIPDYDGPAVLVQGDTGPGNFMYEDGHVTAIVDWELAHFGDPMDDVAWLSLRSAQEPFTHFPDRLAEYEKLSGHKIDIARVWYYRLFAETRMSTFHTGPIDARVTIAVGSPDAGNSLIYGMLHRRMLIEALAHAVGLDVTKLSIDPDITPSEYQPVYESVLSVLKASAAKAKDPLAARWTKGAARLVKYLQEVERSGSTVDADELDEMTKLLGERPASIEAGRTELARLVGQGEVDELDYVAQMWRCVQRDDYLMRTASGALYDRTWPPLT